MISALEKKKTKRGLCVKERWDGFCYLKWNSQGRLHWKVCIYAKS